MCVILRPSCNFLQKSSNSCNWSNWASLYVAPPCGTEPEVWLNTDLIFSRASCSTTFRSRVILLRCRKFWQGVPTFLIDLVMNRSTKFFFDRVGKIVSHDAVIPTHKCCYSVQRHAEILKLEQFSCGSFFLKQSLVLYGSHQLYSHFSSCIVMPP